MFFYKVMWVYKEKVTACWQSNTDYSLEACQSPKMCTPSPPPPLLSLPPPSLPPRGNYSKYSGLKRFFSLALKLGRWE